jgi:hypothetical protein
MGLERCRFGGIGLDRRKQRKAPQLGSTLQEGEFGSSSFFCSLYRNFRGLFLVAQILGGAFRFTSRSVGRCSWFHVLENFRWAAQPQSREGC